MSDFGSLIKEHSKRAVFLTSLVSLAVSITFGVVALPASFIAFTVKASPALMTAFESLGFSEGVSLLFTFVSTMILAPLSALAVGGVTFVGMAGLAAAVGCVLSGFYLSSLCCFLGVPAAFSSILDEVSSLPSLIKNIPNESRNEDISEENQNKKIEIKIEEHRHYAKNKKISNKEKVTKDNYPNKAITPSYNNKVNDKIKIDNINDKYSGDSGVYYQFSAPRLK